MSTEHETFKIAGYAWIIAKPGHLGGKPAVLGTRLSVAFILDCLAEGMTATEIATDYPGFPVAALPEILKFASERLNKPEGPSGVAA